MPLANYIAFSPAKRNRNNRFAVANRLLYGGIAVTTAINLSSQCPLYTGSGAMSANGTTETGGPEFWIDCEFAVHRGAWEHATVPYM